MEMSYKDFSKFFIEFLYAIGVVLKLYHKRCLTKLMDFARQQKISFEILYCFLQIPSPLTIPDFHTKSHLVWALYYAYMVFEVTMNMAK